jgi:hypothetical protein
MGGMNSQVVKTCPPTVNTAVLNPRLSFCGRFLWGQVAGFIGLQTLHTRLVVNTFESERLAWTCKVPRRLLSFLTCTEALPIKARIGPANVIVHAFSPCQPNSYYRNIIATIKKRLRTSSLGMKLQRLLPESATGRFCNAARTAIRTPLILRPSYAPPVSLAASLSKSRTSSSLVCEKSLYHSPTARKGSGAAAHTTLSTRIQIEHRFRGRLRVRQL